MVRKTRSSSLNLATQGLLLLIGMVLLASLAIGVPAIWLIREQLNRQAWQLVEQGSVMINVLLDARYNELNNLAILTAQRPTLIQLLTLEDPQSLAAYLETLREGAGLDLVMICGDQQDSVVQVGLQVPAEACQTSSYDRILPTGGSSPPAWLLASQPLPEIPSRTVIVGQPFDHDFINQLSAQVGLDSLLLFQGQPFAGSLPAGGGLWEAVAARWSNALDDPQKQQLSARFSQAGWNYYTTLSAYHQTGLASVALLSAAEIAGTQQRLTRSAVVGILLVILLSSGAAVLLSRRISQPLEHLRDSAIALRKGDLATPVAAQTRVREISDVAYALEDARVALRHSLDELRQEKAWGDYLLESVVEGIVTFDRQARVTFFSRGAERITSWQQAQVLGKHIDEVFRSADRDATFSQRIPPPGGKAEILTILVDDRPLTLAVSGARLTPPEAGRATLAVSIRDISNEEAMRGLLGDFLANITHEFRTPLTALAVSIELLLDQLPGLSQAEIHELLASTRLGVLSLENLIDNLLEGASIETGRFRVSPHPTELEDVIGRSVSLMQPLAEKNRLQLKVELPPDLPLVQADARRTSQVLVNLLSNAIKWGPQGSEILVQAVVSGDRIKVSVADQGPGVNPAHKENLFIRFGHRQLDEGRAEYGAGLGLSVVKAIVESQGGQVGEDESQQGGAVFWFTLPVLSLPVVEGEDTP